MTKVTFGVHGKFFPFSSIEETARYAEEHGLDTYWLGDRISGLPKPHSIEAWSALAAVAMKTKRIQLGISVTDPFRRTPALFAQTVVALDHISGGRVAPGLGVGEAINLTPFGIVMERPAARMEEFIRLAKQFWTGEPVTFEGKFFRTKGAIIQPTPVQQPHPPLWIAANTPVSLKITGRVGDGWLPGAKTPAMYREDLAIIRAEAARVGRDPKAIIPGLFFYVVVSEDREYARQVVEDFARRVLVWWQSSLKRLGVRAGNEDVSLVNFDGSPKAVEQWYEAGRQLPLVAAEQLVSFGPPEVIAERIRAFVDAGVEHFAIVSLDGLGDLDRWKETTRLFGEQVIPLATRSLA